MKPQRCSTRAVRFGFWLLVFCTLCFPYAVEADFAPKEWTRWRDVLIPDKSASPAHVLVELDGKVFASSQSDLRDLRLSDEQGTEVPSKIVVEREETRAEPRPVEILDRAVESNGNSSFTLDLGDNPKRHNRVELQTESRNFSRQVRMEISDDNRRWAMARSDGYIFDFSRDTRARFLEVGYPVSTKRYIRVTILNGRERPLETAGATVQFSAEQEETLTNWPATIQSRTVDQKLRATVLLLDLGYAKLPTARIELQTQASNFHRHVEIEGSNKLGDEQGAGRQFWASVASGEIFSIALDRANRKHLRIDYPERRYRFLRVKIFHYDDRPLEFTDVKMSGHSHRLLFRREPGKNYRLYYGNAAVTAPRYDLEQLSPYLELSNLSVLGLGEEQRQSPERQAGQPWLEKQPLWLWGTLLLAALLLGGLIYRLAKMTAG